jgi:hypothetical protein
MSALLSIRQYCRNQLKADVTRYLLIPGRAKAISPEVDNVFVSITLQSTTLPAHLYNDNTILRAGNRQIIFGDPGSGKSSLLKRIFRNACRACIVAPSNSRLPVHVELKRLAPPATLSSDITAGAWLLQELRNQVSEVEGFEMKNLFDSCLTTTGLLVLFDGLDEVSGDRYGVIAAALRGLNRLLAGRGDQNLVIVTSRTQYAQEVRADLSEDYPMSSYIVPLGQNEIYTFLKQWSLASDSKVDVLSIYAQLTDRHSVRQMCSNPLFLAMYVASYQDSNAERSPETRTAFYREIINELLLFRRGKPASLGRPVCARAQHEAILGQIAFENMMDRHQPANSLQWPKVLQISQRVWQCSEGEAERRLHELANETGIIVEDRPGETLRFMHITFCEYFAALECASGRGASWSTLLANHRSNIAAREPNLAVRLSEVIPLALALLDQPDRHAALREVAENLDNGMLGRCFLEAKLYDSSCWPEYLMRESVHLSAPAPDEPASWIRRLHVFAVAVSDAQSWMRDVARRAVDPILEEALPKIVANNHDTFRDVFSVYAVEDPAAAFRLAESIGLDLLHGSPFVLIRDCQEEPFLTIAMKRAAESGPEGRYWMSLLAEAALRYTNVAHRMNTTEAPDWMKAELRTRKVPPVVRASTPGAYYRCALIIGLQHIERYDVTARRKTFPMLSMLRSLSWQRRARRLYVLRAAASMAAVIFGCVAVLLHGFSEAVGMSITSYSCLLIVSALFGYYRDVRFALLNVESARNRTMARFGMTRRIGVCVGRLLLRPEQRSLGYLAQMRQSFGSDVGREFRLLPRCMREQGELTVDDLDAIKKAHGGI